METKHGFNRKNISLYYYRLKEIKLIETEILSIQVVGRIVQSVADSHHSLVSEWLSKNLIVFFLMHFNFSKEKENSIVKSSYLKKKGSHPKPIVQI